MTVTDEMCEAAVKADQVDRIQGFSYKTDHVIRDVYSAPGEQVIWRLSKEIPGAEDRFYHQCRIERMRKVLEAALSVSSPVRRGPCQVCGETADLKCGPSRFGDETWACKDCWEPEAASHSRPHHHTPGKAE